MTRAMTGAMTGRARGLLASAWVPAVLVGIFTLAMLVALHVPFTHVAAFVAYLGLGITLPGTLVWRWVDRRARTLAADLVLGTVVGYVVQAPVYLAVLAAGIPRAIVLWPALAVVVSLAVPALRRAAWRRPTTVPARAPLASWTGAVVMGYAVLTLGRFLRANGPLTDAALSRAYLDEPFHLALVGELRNHFPPEVPFAHGARLYYHWLVHAHTAASSWSTGLGTAELYRQLVLTAVSIVTLLAMVVVTNEIAGPGRRWPGVVALAVFALSPLPDFFGWSNPSRPWGVFAYLNNLVYWSGTFAFAQLPFLLVVLLVVRILRIADTSWRHWALLGLTLLVVGGSKSSSLPPLLAGLLGAAAVALLVRRDLAARAWGMLAVAAGSFVVDQVVFYGPGTRATTIDPLATIMRFATPANGLAERDGAVPAAVVAALTVVFVLLHASTAIGALGWGRRRGWLAPELVFVVGTWAAGLGALLVLSHESLAQVYFYRSVMTLPAIMTAVGFGELVGDRVPRRAVAGIGAALLAGLLVATLARAVTAQTGPSARIGTPLEVLGSRYLFPFALGVVGLALVAGVVLVLRRRVRLLGVSVLALCVAVVVGSGLRAPYENVATVVHDPRGPGWTPQHKRVLVRQGGLAAARWVRAHSDPDDVIATNGHCFALEKGPTCDRRRFWLAAYSERRVLVEGWAYVAPETVGMPSNDVTNSNRLPYWDPKLLRANDLAFEKPTPERLATLRDRWHVRLLVVDTSAPSDLARLEELARPVFRSGSFEVLALRGD